MNSARVTKIAEQLEAVVCGAGLQPVQSKPTGKYPRGILRSWTAPKQCLQHHFTKLWFGLHAAQPACFVWPTTAMGGARRSYSGGVAPPVVRAASIGPSYTTFETQNTSSSLRSYSPSRTVLGAPSLAAKKTSSGCMQRHCGAQITAACSPHHLVHAVMAFTTAYGWCGATEVAATFFFSRLKKNT